MLTLFHMSKKFLVNIGGGGGGEEGGGGLSSVLFLLICANEFYDVILFSPALKDIEIQTTVKS